MSNKGGRVSPDYLADIAPEYAIRILPGGAKVATFRIFQFHKGSIRINASWEGGTSFYPNFNSIKVQLEYQLLHLHSIHRVFQFHKGSIRIASWEGGTSFYPIFQFHKGSIRIRLTESVSRQIVRFQFHKGSIRIQGTFTNLEKMKIFQFHKGSIRIKWHSRWGRW